MKTRVVCLSKLILKLSAMLVDDALMTESIDNIFYRVVSPMMRGSYQKMQV